MKMNLGCGFDVKDGWLNTNHFSHVPVDGAIYFDALEDHPDTVEQFDFILVNHVLCTIPYKDVKVMLKNIHKMLKIGGTVQIIDMDMLKAIYAYQNKHEYMFPIAEGNIDWKFCMHVSGYSTRHSIFTPAVMKQFLIDAGFNKFSIKKKSEYDIRPNESFIIEATK